MDKKELKQFTKDNGFYLNSYGEVITNGVKARISDYNKSSNGVVFMNEGEIPEGDNIMIFEGVFSQNYKKGKKSRNGYKIDTEGWDFSDYKQNPIILYQHNDSKPIGRAISMRVNSSSKNLEGLYYIDLNRVDTEADKNRIIGGGVRGISTGHITLDDAIEDNSDGKRYTVEDAFEKFGFDNVLDALRGDSDMFTYVVTKALMLESSMVTIGSNEAAQAFPNSIGNSFKTKYNDLFEKYNTMEKKINEAEETVENTEVTASTETTAEVENVEETTEETETTEEVTTNDVEETEEKTEDVQEPNITKTDDQGKVEELGNKINELTETIQLLAQVIPKLSDKVINMDARLDNFEGVINKINSLSTEPETTTVNTVISYGDKLSSMGIDATKFK